MGTKCQKISSFRFFDICGPICQHFCPRVSFLTFAALEYAQKSDIAKSNQLLTDMLITLRDLLDVGDKMKILEPSLGYWNTANMTELKDIGFSQNFHSNLSSTKHRCSRKPQNHQIGGVSLMFSSL